MLYSPIICGWQVYWLFSDDQRVKFIEKQVTEADTFDSDSVSSAAPSKEPSNCWVLLFFPYAARKKNVSFCLHQAANVFHHTIVFSSIMPRIMTRNPAVRNFFAKKQAYPAFTSAEGCKPLELCPRRRFRAIPHKAKKQGA